MACLQCKKKKTGLLLCLCVCLCALMDSHCRALCWSGLINDWNNGFERLSSGRSCVKVAVCVFLRVFPRRSAVYFFASVAFFFFSADNKESGNGSLSPATNPSRALIATNSCHFELRGLHFFVSLASWFIFWWWPTSACLAVEAQMQQLDEGRVLKKNWNAKKKKKPLKHYIPPTGSDLMCSFPGF